MLILIGDIPLLVGFWLAYSLTTAIPIYTIKTNQDQEGLLKHPADSSVCWCCDIYNTFRKNLFELIKNENIETGVGSVNIILTFT